MYIIQKEAYIVGTKADGLRLINEYDSKYDAKIISTEVHDRQIMHGIHLISLEDKDLAGRMARSRGYTMEDI